MVSPKGTSNEEVFPNGEATKEVAPSSSNDKDSLTTPARVPWNKGRTWSPEEREKIRQRTKEAMWRPDVVEKKKKYLDELKKKSEDLKKSKETAKLADQHDPTIGKEASKKTVRGGKTGVATPRKEVVLDDDRLTDQSDAPVRPRRTPSRKARAAETSGSSAANGQPAKQPAKQALPRKPAKASSSVSEGMAAPRKPPTQRSKEHNARIAESVRRKWQDKEYRDRVVGRIRDSKLTSGDTSSSGTKKRSSVPRKPSASASQQAHQAVYWANIRKCLLQLVEVEEQINETRTALQEMQSLVEVFRNDPAMLDRVQLSLDEAYQQLRMAQQLHDSLSEQLPPNVTYNDKGQLLLVQGVEGPAVPDKLVVGIAAVARQPLRSARIEVVRDNPDYIYYNSPDDDLANLGYPPGTYVDSLDAVPPHSSSNGTSNGRDWIGAPGANGTDDDSTNGNDRASGGEGAYSMSTPASSSPSPPSPISNTSNRSYEGLNQRGSGLSLPVVVDASVVGPGDIGSSSLGGDGGRDGNKEGVSVSRPPDATVSGVSPLSSPSLPSSSSGIVADASSKQPATRKGARAQVNGWTSGESGVGYLPNGYVNGYHVSEEGQGSSGDDSSSSGGSQGGDSDLLLGVADSLTVHMALHPSQTARLATSQPQDDGGESSGSHPSVGGSGVEGSAAETRSAPARQRRSVGKRGGGGKRDVGRSGLARADGDVVGGGGAGGSGLGSEEGGAGSSV